MRSATIGMFVMATVTALTAQNPSRHTSEKAGVLSTDTLVTSDVDAIDPVSGNLSVRIPITRLQDAAGGFTAALSLIYDSNNIYERTPLYNPLSSAPGPDQMSVSDSGGWRYNTGYSIEVDRLDHWYVNYPPLNSIVCGSESVSANPDLAHPFTTRLVSPDGSKHLLRLRGYPVHGDGYPISPERFTNNYSLGEVRPWCPSGVSAPTAGQTLTYFTDDSSYIKVVVTMDPSAIRGYRWKAYPGDGSTIEGQGADSTTIRDRNGNTLVTGKLVNPFTGNAITTYTLGPRGVSVEHTMTSDTTKLSDKVTIQRPSASATQFSAVVWNVVWAYLSVSGRYDGTPNAPFPTQQTSKVPVVGYIQVPIDAGGDAFYQFSYYGDWGQMSGVTFPAAGTNEPAAATGYDYEPLNNPVQHHIWPRRRISAKRVYDNVRKIPATPQTWSYLWNQPSSLAGAA